MEKIYLVKMYIRWNNDKESKSWRDNATPLWACNTWEKTKTDILKQIEWSRKDNNSLYKKLYFIQNIELYK